MRFGIPFILEAVFLGDSVDLRSKRLNRSSSCLESRLELLYCHLTNNEDSTAMGARSGPRPSAPEEVITQTNTAAA